MEGTMGRRTVLLVAALVVAALGTTMVFLYVNGVNDRALAKQEPVKVLVAKNLIPAGTSAEDASASASFDLKTISRGDLVTGAISSPQPLAGKVTNSTIYPGEQILPQKFGDPGAASNLSIPKGKMTVSVQLNDPAQVAGFVRAGNDVALFVDSATKSGLPSSRLLLPKIHVLAIGNTTTVPQGDAASSSGAKVSTTILTFAVSQEDYQKVQYASGHGRLSIALLGDSVAPSLTVPPTTSENLFN
jgi:pilus assembly protein CpaB